MYNLNQQAFEKALEKEGESDDEVRRIRIKINRFYYNHNICRMKMLMSILQQKKNLTLEMKKLK